MEPQQRASTSDYLRFQEHPGRPGLPPILLLWASDSLLLGPNVEREV